MGPKTKPNSLPDVATTRQLIDAVELLIQSIFDGLIIVQHEAVTSGLRVSSL